MRIALFEDQCATDFNPLVWLRPVFELVCGHFSLRERLVRELPVVEWGAWIRDYLAETYRETQPEAHINRADWLEADSTLLINGRWLPDHETLRQLRPGPAAGILNNTVVYLTLEPDEAPLLRSMEVADLASRLALSRTRVPAGGVLLERPWDLVEHNPRQIRADFALRQLPPLVGNGGQFSHVAVTGPREQVTIDPAARIEPYVFIDATRGPVSIEAGASVQAFTRLEGPCHIATAAQLFGANIRGGTTIGPVCRVGGEIEASILQGYVNKHHDGFLGHSYLCPWVNLGALTTNSDLKNDYSPVRVPLSAAGIESGLMKVGCFVGDHTKTGLGSLINTGSSIGVMCLVLPMDGLLPKFIPSFAGVWHGTLGEGLSLERNLAAARAAMNRRDRELTVPQERLLRFLHQMTRGEREQAIRVSAAKTQGPAAEVR